MSRLVQLGLEDGGSILVEVDERVHAPVTRGRTMRGPGPEDLVEDAGKSVERVLGGIGPVVKGIVSEIRAAAERPDEVEVEFAVNLSADARVIIARAGGEANFRIALRWSRDQADGRTDS